MVLSRIWTAFILVALLTAAARFAFQPGQQGIFSQLVTGKNTDTIAVRIADSASVPAIVHQQLSNQKLAVWKRKSI